MRHLLATALMLVGAAAGAQVRGSITLRGHVSQMASIRFHSDRPVGPGVHGTNHGGDRLDYQLDLGDVGIVPGRQNGVRGGEVKLILRSSTAYVLSAQVTSEGLVAGAGEIGLRDIGFGIPSAEIVPSGAKARSDGTQVHDPGKFDSDPLTAAQIDGEPEYAASLADLAGGVSLLSGERISYGGSLSTPTNGLIVATRYAVHPRYFKTNPGFTATVTYTISTP